MPEGQARTAEYEALLEAYNQYVVAYDYLNTEYSKLQLQLQQSQTPAGDQTDLQSSLQALQLQLQEREVEILVNTEYLSMTGRKHMSYSNIISMDDMSTYP